MLNRPLISVVVPVYNIEKEIVKTLESLCIQSYNNLQIVVINDGSSDGSLEVCKKFAAKDNRIVLINKNNEGLPLARESGIKAATGDYIHHLDGGDYLSSDAYEILVDELNSKNYPDTLFFGFYYTTSQERQKSQPYPSHLNTSIDILKHIWTTQQYNCVWQYIHRRKLAEEIIFDKRLNLGEDTFYTSQLLSLSKNIAVLDKNLLYYVIDEGISMSRSALTDKKVESIKITPSLIDNLFKGSEDYNSLKMELLALKLQSDATLILGGYLDEMNRINKDYAAAFEQYPQLKTMGVIKSIAKLVKLYSTNRLLYALQLRYYKRKGKIR